MTKTKRYNSATELKRHARIPAQSFQFDAKMDVRRSTRIQKPPDRYTGGTPARPLSPTPWPPKYASREEDEITIDQLEPLPIIYPADLYKLTQYQRETISATNASKEQHQKDKLRGFTTRQLYDLDAITNRKLRASTLDIEIHPAFRRKRWEEDVDPQLIRQHFYSLDDMEDKPDGLGGTWVAGNDLVWGVMEPVLRIATYIISNVHILPFIDGLFFGQRRDVDNARRPPNETKQLLEIAFRSPPVDSTEAERKIRGMFEEWLKNFNLVFGFKENHEAPWDGSATDVDTWAVTVIGLDKNVKLTIRLFLTYEMVLPLMRPDLNEAERMGLQWFVANTFVHELIHAMWYVEDFYTLNSSRTNQDPEPYMSSDPVSELGWAFEFKLFGGSPHPFRPYFVDEGLSGMTSPLGFWLETQWPTRDHGEMATEPILLAPPLFNTQTSYPIPATFYEDIQDNTFWHVGVRKYGNEVLFGRSRFQGSHSNSSYEPNDDGNPGVRTKFEKQVTDLRNTSDSNKLSELRNAIVLSPEDKQVLDFGERLWNADEFEMSYLRYMSIMREKSSEATREMSMQDPTLDERALSRVIQLIDEARSAHEGVVKNLLNYEKFTSSISIDRRKDLLIWNKQTRDIVHQLRIAVVNSPWISPLQKNVIPLLIRGLEWCVMNLWSPFDFKLRGLNEYVPEFMEAASVLAKSNVHIKVPGQIQAKLPPYAQLQPIIAPISRYPELLVNATHLLTPLLNPPNITLQQHVTNLDSALEIIKKYRNGFRGYDIASLTFTGFTKECPEIWKRYLDLWVRIGEAILLVYREKLVNTMRVQRIGYPAPYN